MTRKWISGGIVFVVCMMAAATGNAARLGVNIIPAFGGGLQVTSYYDYNSMAYNANPRINVGDVIFSINGMPTNSLTEMIVALQTLDQTSPNAASILIRQATTGQVIAAFVTRMPSPGGPTPVVLW